MADRPIHCMSIDLVRQECLEWLNKVAEDAVMLPIARANVNEIFDAYKDMVSDE